MELKTQILPAILEIFYAKHPNLAMAKLAKFEVFRPSRGKGYIVSFKHISNPDGPGFEMAVMDEQIEKHKFLFGMGRVDENLYQVRHHGRTLTAKIGPIWRAGDIVTGNGPTYTHTQNWDIEWALIDIYDEAGESVLKTYYEVNQGEIDDLLEAVIDTQELVEL